MVFYKNCYQFQKSVNKNHITDKYEVFSLSGVDAFVFSNKTQVQDFAKCLTHYIDEIIFHVELMLLRLSSYQSVLNPQSLNSSNSEFRYLEYVYSASLYCSKLKVYKETSIQLHQLISGVLSILETISNACVMIDKRFTTEIEHVFHHSRELHEQIRYYLRNYQKTIFNEDLKVITNKK